MSDPDLCPKCGNSLLHHAYTKLDRGVTFHCPQMFVSKVFEQLREGMVVQVTEPDNSLGVYLVEEVARSGFRASHMSDDGPASKDVTEFRVRAYRNHKGTEWFGIPGLTILDEGLAP